MPEIGSLEILVVAAVAFVVFGPERLPGLARQVGRYASQFRRTLSEVKDEFRMEMDDDEAKPRRDLGRGEKGPGAAEPQSTDTGQGAPAPGGDTSPKSGDAPPSPEG
jgi:sec-independent protein translocase protein TatB